MYRVVKDQQNLTPDSIAFIELLNGLDRQQQLPQAQRLFDAQAELIVTRVPGRLDVMGGFADYSGSLVLELPIQEATFVALQRDPARLIRIVSLSEDFERETAFEMALDDFENAGEPVDYEFARDYFRREPQSSWAAYVAGVFPVLMRERHIRFEEGARILVASRVPEGKGVSSSAALEVAVMQAVATAFSIELEPRELALLCQVVENRVVGAPCGIMDQMTCALGEANRLLALLCQPAELRGLVPVPDELGLWGIDSGVRHRVAGTDYGSVRVGTFMGYRIIAGLAGLSIAEAAAGELVSIDDPLWQGYLANLAPSEFEHSYAAQLPERMGGAEFLDHYRGTTDLVTRVERERSYPVRAPTAHAVYEHHRVRLFAELLAGPMSERRLELLGELMYQAHESYTACDLNSEGTDLLVQFVREAGTAQGLFGAKITGGGSGGTVAVLGRSDAGPSIERIGEKYARATGHRPYIFRGSSQGAAGFGHLKIKSI